MATEKTALSLDQGVLYDIRSIAAARNMSVSALVSQALAEWIDMDEDRHYADLANDPAAQEALARRAERIRENSARLAEERRTDREALNAG
ncbi:hypothetical protein ACWEQG_06585 [Microbispora sp. NPDC004025]|uniref:hypothetical protein n=1 Tax=Microbispora sp. NPDC049633 TaxID=3154355 RepID=UPI0034448CE0